MAIVPAWLKVGSALRSKSTLRSRGVMPDREIVYVENKRFSANIVSYAAAYLFALNSKRP